MASMKIVKKLAPPREPLTVYDVDAVAPEYFSFSATDTDLGRRLTAFVDAMSGVDRAVLLKRDEDTLYLSSIPEVPNVG